MSRRKVFTAAETPKNEGEEPSGAKALVPGKNGKPTRVAVQRLPFVLEGGDYIEDQRNAAKWSGLLTSRERKFLTLCARGYEPADAAQLVGEQREAGPSMLSALLSMRAGEAFLRATHQQIINGELMGLALNGLAEVMRHGDYRAVVAAARTAMEAAAYFGKRADETVAALRSAGADPNLMGPEELAMAAEATRKEAEQLRAMIAAQEEARRRVETGELVMEGEAEATPSEMPWD